MNELVDGYSCFLQDHLNHLFGKKKVINPVELNKERLRAKAIFISSVFFLKYGSEAKYDNLIDSSTYWLKSLFGEDNLLSKMVNDGKDGFSQNLLHLIPSSIISDLHIPTLYESLLGIESLSEKDGTTVSIAKNYRNKLGSYYTPPELAKKVTQSTIDFFLEKNIGKNLQKESKKEIVDKIRKITYVDFSCGGGNFLLEILDYFKCFSSDLGLDDSIRKSLLRDIVLNISAFDVDYLALEVAKISLLLSIEDTSLYEKVSGNFHHCNFLIHADTQLSNQNRLDAFENGFIYHEKLALDRETLNKYDIILGNPPWEKIRFEEKKFYAQYSRAIPNAHFKTSRKDEIRKALKTNSYLQGFAHKFETQLLDSKKRIKDDEFFSLSNNGELNTYALFTEAALHLKSERGVIGLVLKSAVVTSQVNKTLFKYLVNHELIEAVYDFINRKKIFSIDSRERFCFLLFSSFKSSKFKVAMNLTDINDINPQLTTELSKEDLKLINPITMMLPNFKSPSEADFLINKSKSLASFREIYPQAKFGRIVHFTSHTEFITKSSNKKNLPIYEGKFFSHFDAKYSGFNGVKEKDRYGSKSSSILLHNDRKSRTDYIPESRFYIDKIKWKQLSKNYDGDFMLAWRSLTSATNRRSCIATILPFMPASQSVQFLIANDNDLLYLAGLFNSITFDFFVKIKMSGIDLTQSVINQIPVPINTNLKLPIEFNGRLATYKQHINRLVASLLITDSRLSLLLERVGFNMIDQPSDQQQTIKNLDLLFFSLYEISSSEIRQIMNHFDSLYEEKDIVWFENNLENLVLDNAISSA